MSSRGKGKLNAWTHEWMGKTATNFELQAGFAICSTTIMWTVMLQCGTVLQSTKHPPHTPALWRNYRSSRSASHELLVCAGHMTQLPLYDNFACYNSNRPPGTYPICFFSRILFSHSLCLSFQSRGIHAVLMQELYLCEALSRLPSKLCLSDSSFGNFYVWQWLHFMGRCKRLLVKCVFYDAGQFYEGRKVSYVINIYGNRHYMHPSVIFLCGANKELPYFVMFCLPRCKFLCTGFVRNGDLNK